MTDTIKVKLVNNTNNVKLAGVNIGGGYVPLWICTFEKYVNEGYNMKLSFKVTW